MNKSTKEFLRLFVLLNIIYAFTTLFCHFLFNECKHYVKRVVGECPYQHNVFDEFVKDVKENFAVVTKYNLKEK